ncbi:MAG: ABC transporter permease [Deltaproteobacteria bacterium]|nr:ABC transporter permease [Deltaproteobacteria bacterium]
MAIRTVDLARSVRHTFKTSRLRVALTLLGIMIGTGAMVLLAGLLVAGEEALVRLAQDANETDMIEVSSAEAPRKDAKRTTRELSRYDAEALASSELLAGARINAAHRKQSTAHWRDAEGQLQEKRTTLFGGELDSLSLYRIEVERGRYFTSEDFAQRRRVCVVGQEMWTDLLGRRTELGELRITVDGVVFEVVGVLAHKPTMGRGNGTWMWNRRVLIPSSSYQSVVEYGRNVRAVFVRLEGVERVAERMVQLTNVVERTILRRHYGVKNFEVESDARGEDQEKLILRIIEVLLFGTGVIALVVGGINIMNIMLVTVTERTKEIGLRRAVGAAPSEIARQFLLEAATLAAAGGVLGVAGGVVVTYLASVVLTQLVAPWRFVVEPWAVALALGMAVGTGVLFGLFPALRASRLDPVEALRGE